MPYAQHSLTRYQHSHGAYVLEPSIVSCLWPEVVGQCSSPSCFLSCGINSCISEVLKQSHVHISLSRKRKSQAGGGGCFSVGCSLPTSRFCPKGQGNSLCDNYQGHVQSKPCSNVLRQHSQCIRAQGLKVARQAAIP